MARTYTSPVTLTTWPDGVLQHRDCFNGTVTLPYPSGGSALGQVYTYPEDSDEVFKTPNQETGSFRSVVRSGVIKMTPYHHSSLKKKYFLASTTQDTMFCLTSRSSWRDTCCGKDTTGPLHRVDQNVYDLHRWVNTGGATSKPDVTLSIDNLKNQAINSAISRSNSSYDLLTEVAELPQTMRLLLGEWENGARRTVDLGKKLPSALRSVTTRLYNVPASLAKLWLTYRYGIMPIIYSIQDLSALAKKKNSVFFSSRGRASGSFTGSGTPFPTGFTAVSTIQINANVRATVRKGYRSYDDFLMDQVQVNPLVTAYELLAYSFVLDWFINVGDMLQSVSRRDFSAQSRGCVSVALSRKVSISLEGPSIVVPPTVQNLYPCGTNTTGGSVTQVGAPLLYQEEERSYNRSLFNPSSAMTLAPGDGVNSVYRALDSIALSTNILQRQLKGFRR